MMKVFLGVLLSVPFMVVVVPSVVAEETGEDRAPFDLDMFGTREVKYQEKER